MGPGAGNHLLIPRDPNAYHHGVFQPLRDRGEMVHRRAGREDSGGLVRHGPGYRRDDARLQRSVGDLPRRAPCDRRAGGAEALVPEPVDERGASGASLHDGAGDAGHGPGGRLVPGASRSGRRPEPLRALVGVRSRRHGPGCCDRARRHDLHRPGRQGGGGRPSGTVERDRIGPGHGRCAGARAFGPQDYRVRHARRALPDRCRRVRGGRAAARPVGAAVRLACHA